MVDQHGEMVQAPETQKERDQQPAGEYKRLERWLEVITAILLGVVAVATAWSGYQSARWSSVQAALYSEASALRVEATRASTLAGQDRIYDAVLFDGWLTAHSEGDTTLANIYVKRFRSEFVAAFNAWLADDPFHSLTAPPGPTFMPQYHLDHAAQANRFEAQASGLFHLGQDANQHGDDYVLITVFLAVVLFLAAISDGFKWQPIRVAVLILATVALVYGIVNLVALPIT